MIIFAILYTFQTPKNLAILLKPILHIYKGYRSIIAASVVACADLQWRSKNVRIHWKLSYPAHISLIVKKREMVSSVCSRDELSHVLMKESSG